MSESQNILYVSYDGLTDPLGQSQILPYVFGLSKHGYRFTIVSFEKNRATAATFEKVKADCQRNHVEWVPLTYHKKPPVLSTLYDVYVLRKTVKRLHRKKNFSLVHCRSYIPALIGLWLKRKYDVRFIFDMRGFWADERVDGGLWRLSNPLFNTIYKYFKKKELQFLRESDVIISLTHNAKHELQSWNVKTSIVVIPCCVDTNLFDLQKINESQKQNLQTQLGITNGEFVLLYLGSWGTWYMTEEMLLFFSQLKTKHPGAKLLVVSTNSIDLKNYEYQHDVIIRSASRQEVPLYISLASASIFFIKPAFSKKASSATKMGELLAMNIPVITNKGWGDVEEMSKQALIYFYDTVILQNFEFHNTQQNRPYCLDHLSLNVGVERYHAVYKNLLQSK